MLAQNLSTLLGGFIFGAGLVVFGMTNPDKLLAFLTLGAHWDRTVMFVLGGAVNCDENRPRNWP